MIIAVSGAGGRMGKLVAEAIAGAPDLDLGPLYDPRQAGSTVAGATIGDDPAALEGADVVVEFTEPDVVMAGCGDIPTKEALAATALLREHFPELKIRFINVVDLFRMQSAEEHPHGLSDRDFDSLFTVDRPIIFNFHGYPWLIHRLAYRRTNHRNLHVRGYKEKGNINTPLELAIENEVDRFSLAIDVINRVPGLQVAGAHVKEKLRDMQIDCRAYAHTYGVDIPEINDWVWPY